MELGSEPIEHDSEPVELSSKLFRKTPNLWNSALRQAPSY
jgi:hypothetical protein